MDNVVLDVVMLEPECVLLRANNRALEPVNQKLTRELDLPEWPTFRLTIVGAELVEFDFEAEIEETLLYIEKGLDYKLSGLYDIPEWGIKDYSVGKILIEALKRAYKGYGRDDWKDYLKYLKRGNV